jgi:hypothetical protein
MPAYFEEAKAGAATNASTIAALAITRCKWEYLVALMTLTSLRWAEVKARCSEKTKVV